ncbi:MAG: HAMP domain-containing histidine kinase [Streptococcaceae bacterium]|nr:HAMP domain-containing histidine kinase [Streptococcaceae bacterium]
MEKPKRSLLWRWSFANALFFFIAFTLFAAIAYRSATQILLGRQKEAIGTVMQLVDDHLSQSTEPLSGSNLRTVFEYRANRSTGVIQTSDVLSELIASRTQLFVYGINKQLIFSTAGQSIMSIDTTDGKIEIVNTAQGYQGYLLSQPIRSQKTGKIVAYAQAFFDLKPYYGMRNALIAWLSGLALAATLAAALFGYFKAKRDLRPLKGISDSMMHVTANPLEIFTPISLQSKDEIQQIGDFYNVMMARLMIVQKSQKDFISDVSHELRTPIAIIEGNLKMLMRWGKDDPSMLAETLEISVHEIARMNTMISEMLELSRSEQLSEENRLATCMLSKECAEAIRNFRKLYPDFEIKFRDESKGTGIAQVNAHHYTQMLTILLDNAVKYTGQGEKLIEIALSVEADFVTTRLTDHGMGIPESEVPRVFERFFRADKSRNREIGGTGIGLAVLSNLVKFYAGKIVLESAVGVGTTFTLKLPKAD